MRLLEQENPCSKKSPEKSFKRYRYKPQGFPDFVLKGLICEQYFQNLLNGLKALLSLIMRGLEYKHIIFPVR
jgi:hypothetical protein